MISEHSMTHRPLENLNSVACPDAIEDEIREMRVHIIPYAGFPAAFDVFEVARKTRRSEDDAKEA